MKFNKNKKVSRLEKVIKETINETQDWCINTWSNFRDLNNYWVLRDEAYSTQETKEILKFKTLKLKWIKTYNFHKKNGRHSINKPQI
jgi:hypothetical protein|tara:strand:+ start:246 stop:506 length:261 start_codon:yes stop_codon:yes gene_type:complete